MNNRSQHPSFAISKQDEPFLAKLPANFAKPIKLLHFEKMNYVEIATDLGIPIGTVKSRIHRGRAMLRRERVMLAACNETYQEATLA